LVWCFVDLAKSENALSKSNVLLTWKKATKAPVGRERLRKEAQTWEQNGKRMNES
jgi:hypothetical protein